MAGRAIAVSRSTQDAPSGGSNFKLIHYRRVAALFSGLIFGLLEGAAADRLGSRLNGGLVTEGTGPIVE